jgi:hypothetical protein
VTQAVRKAANEHWFRELNELLEHRAVESATSDGPFEIVCECANEECTERIPISVAAYEAIRANATTFAVVPGHQDPTVERIVETTEHYDVVEKLGEAGAVAEIENPREGEEPEDKATAG